MKKFALVIALAVVASSANAMPTNPFTWPTGWFDFLAQINPFVINN